MVHTFKKVYEFIDTLPDGNAGEMLGYFVLVESNLTEHLNIKTLRGKIKELIVGQYRFVFFRFGGTVYVVDAFKKKSAKTPPRIIKRATKMYQRILNQNL